jgi:hypothetical protein
VFRDYRVIGTANRDLEHGIKDPATGQIDKSGSIGVSGQPMEQAD